MKTVSKLAAASIVGLAVMSIAPASAQRAPSGNRQQPAQPAAQGAAPQKKLIISKGAQKPLSELQAAYNAKDAATFAAKLPAAEAAVKTPEERFYIAQLRLNLAIEAKDRVAQRTAIDAAIRSGGAQPAELVKFHRALGGMAYEAKDYDGAIASYTKVLELQPGDADTTNNLLVLHRERKAYPQVMAIVQQSIAARKAAGQAVPENLYLVGLQAALDGNVKPQMLSYTRELLTAYPTPKNWSNGLNIYRQAVETDDDETLDTFRLMRASKALQSSNEYLALGGALARGRYYAEARDVVNEGAATGKYAASSPRAAELLKEVSGKIAGDKTALASLEGRARSEAKGEFALRIAEGYYGHGDFVKAADFYRVALQKGSVDANLVNSRLGMALAQAGRKAEAEAAFKAVTGQRAELAGLWMLWLNQRG